MLNRRQFSTRLAATAAGLALSSPDDAAAAKSRGFRLSVMLWTLRPRYTAEQGIELAAAAGYNGFELVDEDKGWSPADIARIRGEMSKLRIECDAVSGVATGFAEQNAAEQLCAELSTRMDQAERIDCRRIILLSGKRDERIARDTQHAICVNNLQRAGQVAARRQFELLIEPIDLLENPSTYLTRVSEAFQIARAVNLGSISVLYDFYHEARAYPAAASVNDLLAPLRGNVDLLGLVHVADVPGRHTPGSGMIAYPRLYQDLIRLGYEGWLAMEFLPLGDAETELRGAATEARETASAFAKP